VAARPAGAGRAGEGRGIARNKYPKHPHSGPNDLVAHLVVVVDKGPLASSCYCFVGFGFGEGAAARLRQATSRPHVKSKSNTWRLTRCLFLASSRSAV
jgi:hypothetical protein